MRLFTLLSTLYSHQSGLDNSFDSQKSPAVVWTQLPLDNFIKQMEMHNEYLGIYVKRHFGGSVEQADASNDDTLVIHGKHRRDDDKIHDLLVCQTKLVQMTIAKCLMHFSIE